MNRKRSRSREVAMEVLYQMEIQERFVSKVHLERYDEALDTDYLEALFSAFEANRAEIDAHISGRLKNWRFDRLSKMDVSILRLALTEMLYIDDIPHKVSVNESVELAKKYVDEKSAKFINGVLSHYVDEE